MHSIAYTCNEPQKLNKKLLGYFMLKKHPYEERVAL